MENLDFVLILKEVSYHPSSYITKLKGMFEDPSIITVNKKDGLKHYRKRPMFDEKYLVIFEDVKRLKENLDDIRLGIMFPIVVVQNDSQVDDARFICTAAKVRYKIMNNEFTASDAFHLIQREASEEVPESICKAIVSQVGLNPMRIITAVSVCEQVGYTKSNIEKYVDKWMYGNVRGVIECLLGVARSKKAIKNSLLYLYINRHWFNTVRKNIITELDAILAIYKDKLEGELSDTTMIDYIETKHIPRARVEYASRLFDKVSIASLFKLREQVKVVSLLDLILSLSPE